MNKNYNGTIKFDSATVTLDANHKTDEIILNVDAQMQNVPIAITTPTGTQTVNYNFNPVTQQFTPSTSVPPTGPNGQPLPQGQTPMTPTDQPQLTLTKNTPTTGSNPTFTVTTTTPGFSVNPGSTITVNPNGSVTQNVSLTQYKEIKPTVSFASVGTTGSVGTTFTPKVEIGTWLSYQDPTTHQFHLIQAPLPTTGQVPVDTPSTTAFDTWATATHINTADAGIGENFNASNKNLTGLITLTPTIDATTGAITWTTTSTDVNNYVQVVQNGNDILVTQDALHGIHISAPSVTDNTDAINAASELVVEQTSANTFGLFVIDKASGNVTPVAQTAANQANVNAQIKTALKSGVGTTNPTLVKFIDSLTFAFDSATGAITATDTSNGAFGLKLDSASTQRTAFSDQGYLVNIIADTTNPNFNAGIQMHISPNSLNGTNLPVVQVNLGTITYDSGTNTWTQPVAPTIASHSGVALKVNNDGTVTLTTDGTFRPTDGNGITWIAATGNDWTGTLDAAHMLTNTFPQSQVNLDILAEAIIEAYSGKVNVVENPAKSTTPVDYGTISVDHNLFTGEYKTVSKSDMTTTTSKTSTGVDPLVSIANTMQTHIGHEAPTSSSLSATATAGFTVTTALDAQNNPVVTLTNSFNPATATPQQIAQAITSAQTQNNFVHPTVTIQDQNGHSVSGKITQDIVSGDYVLVDDTGKTIDALAGGNIQVHITPTTDATTHLVTGFTVTLDSGITQNSYDFTGIEVKTENWDGSGQTTSPQTASGDAISINF